MKNPSGLVPSHHHLLLLQCLRHPLNLSQSILLLRSQALPPPPALLSPVLDPPPEGEWARPGRLGDGSRVVGRFRETTCEGRLRESESTVLGCKIWDF